MKSKFLAQSGGAFGYHRKSAPVPVARLRWYFPILPFSYSFFCTGIPRSSFTVLARRATFQGAGESSLVRDFRTVTVARTQNREQL